MSIKKFKKAADLLYQQGLHNRLNDLSSGDCLAFFRELEQLKTERDTLRVRVGEMAAEVERLSKLNSTDVELGPDGKEWVKTEAAYKFVESVKDKADVDFRWKGYVVREAFVAGAEWQENRKVGTQ